MRRSPALVAAILGAIVVLLVGATLVVVNQLSETGPECTIPRPSGHTTDTEANGGATFATSADPLELDAVPVQHASTINAVGLARGEPERARVIAVATAFQESSLRNLDHGDRDSLGLFQQRPSQGWGTPAQLQDPVYAAGAFFDALEKVRNWEQLPLTEAAQQVQRSGHPDAYAKWEGDAVTLVAALSGGAAPRLSCRSGAAPMTSAAPDRDQVKGADHLTSGLATVLAAAQAELGALSLAEPQPAPTGGTAAEAASVVISVAIPGLDARTAAWALAAWAVAHATSFQISDVAVGSDIWAGHLWRPAAESLPDGQVRISAPN